MQRAEGVVERRNQEPRAMQPQLLERLDSENMASHPMISLPWETASLQAAGTFES